MNTFSGFMSISLELRYSDLVTETNHFVEEEIEFNWRHLSAHGVVSPKPYICLFGSRCIEKPCLAIGSHELRVVNRITVLLTEGMSDVMLVQEMKDIDTHADILEPRPLCRMCHNLLLGIAVGVVDEMFWLEGSRDREGFLDEQLLPVNTQKRNARRRAYQNI